MGADDAPWRRAAAADPLARMPIAPNARDTRPAPTRSPAWTGQRGAVPSRERRARQAFSFAGRGRQPSVAVAQPDRCVLPDSPASPTRKP